MRPVLVLTQQILELIKASGESLEVASVALSAAQRFLRVEPDPVVPVVRSAKKAK